MSRYYTGSMTFFQYVKTLKFFTAIVKIKKAFQLILENEKDRYCESLFGIHHPNGEGMLKGK